MRAVWLLRVLAPARLHYLLENDINLRLFFKLCSRVFFLSIVEG